MDENEVQKAYDTIRNALNDEDFQKWLKNPNIKDSLGDDYDLYATHMTDSDQEPMGYEMWALKRYLAREDEEYQKDKDADENLNAEEMLSGIKVIKLKDGKDVKKLHDAIGKALGEI